MAGKDGNTELPQVTIGENGQNGHGPTQPGAFDIFYRQIQANRTADFQIFMQGPRDEHTALASTILTRHELARKRRIRARRNFFYYGDPNVQELEIMDLIGRIGIGGLGREQAEHVATSQPSILRRAMNRVDDYMQRGNGQGPQGR